MAKGGSRLWVCDWKARRSSLNGDALMLEPIAAQARVLEIQSKLNKWAQDDQDRRFKDLHKLVGELCWR
jgi:hypothetical protein